MGAVYPNPPNGLKLLIGILFYLLTGLLGKYIWFKLLDSIGETCAWEERPVFIDIFTLPFWFWFDYIG